MEVGDMVYVTAIDTRLYEHRGTVEQVTGGLRLIEFATGNRRWFAVGELRPETDYERIRRQYQSHIELGGLLVRPTLGG